MTTPNHPTIRKNPKKTVLIADDMPQVRQDLRLLLQLTSELEVVGEAANGQEAIRQAEILHPDVVIMDVEMPILDGFQATLQIKQRNLAKRVVILSVHSEPEDETRAMQAGADAFIQKGAPYTTLIQSILFSDQ
jgi:DNA-binding NarL/FixJ family response regulator